MEIGPAIHAARNGQRIYRKAWHDGACVVYQRGYPDGIPCNAQTAAVWGMKEGELFRCDPYLQVRLENGSHAMWSPTVGDVLADDWEIAE